MGRKPINEQIPQEEERDFFEDILSSFDNENGVEIEGKIYRKTKPEDSIGRMSFEAIAKVSEEVDEDWLGRHFGSGNYFIKWTFRQGARKEFRQKNYSVGPEYDRFKEAEKKPVNNSNATNLNGLDLGGLLSALTMDKIVAIGAAIKQLKEIFAPPVTTPPPPFDMTKLLEFMASAAQKSTPSDAIVTACLTSLQQRPQQPQQSFAQQIADYKAIEELIKDKNNENAEGGDDMNFWIEKALDYLPLLLQKKNNNFEAVGAEVKGNPFIKDIITSNPDLTKKFFEVARDQYGAEAVQQLARGFGYEARIMPTENQQATQEVKNG